MSAVSSAQVVEVSFVQEVISIEVVEEDGKTEEDSTWHQPEFYGKLDCMSESIFMFSNGIVFVKDEAGNHEDRIYSKMDPQSEHDIG